MAAACLGTPVVVLESNTPKIRALSESLGIPVPVGYEALEADKLQSACDRVLAGPGSSSVSLTELSSRADRNFDGLRNLH